MLSDAISKSLLGGWSIYLIALTALIVTVLKLVVPFVKRQSEFRRIANEVGGNEDRHWLWGHTHKYGLNNFEGLKNSAERVKYLPATCANWLGPFHFTVMLQHPDVVKTVFTRPFPKSVAYTHFVRPLLREGLVTSAGNVWKRHRRLITPIFHVDLLQRHVKVFNKNCRLIYESLESAARNDTIHDVSVDLAHLSYNNLLECVLSQKTERGSENDDMYIKCVQQVSNIIFDRMFSPLIWPNIIFNNIERGKRFYRLTGLIHAKAEKIIQERRAILDSLPNVSEQGETAELADGNKSFTFRKQKGKSLDFLDILIQTKDQDGVGLTDDEICDEVTTFFSAGQDTVASALCWALYYLANHLTIQQKCRDEILKVVGTSSDIGWNDMPKLPYLTQCIKESQRLMPVLHAIGREINEDVTLSHRFNDYKEITIKSGTFVGINIFAMHRNPHIWENPEVFDPDRFSPERSAGRSSFAFVPFSAGSRNCIGQHFAMHQMRVVLGQILRRFEFFRDGETPEPKPLPGITLQSSNGLKLKLKKIK